MPRSGVMVDANWHSKFGSVVSGEGKGMMWARGERTERWFKRGKQERAVGGEVNTEEGEEEEQK